MPTLVALASRVTVPVFRGEPRLVLKMRYPTSGMADASTCRMYDDRGFSCQYTFHRPGRSQLITAVAVGATGTGSRETDATAGVVGSNPNNPAMAAIMAIGRRMPTRVLSSADQDRQHGTHPQADRKSGVDTVYSERRSAICPHGRGHAGPARPLSPPCC